MEEFCLFVTVTFRNLNLKGIISKEIPCLHFVLELATTVSHF